MNDPKRLFDEHAVDIRGAVNAVLESGWYLLGSKTVEFERSFADFCGATHCVGVANGTDALEIALRALEIGAGDEVMMVANAGGYATTAALAVSACPVYVDIDPATLTLDIDSVVAATSPTTRVIVATHLYGYAVDIPRLRRLLDGAGRLDIMILEDCAQAHGAVVAEEAVGVLGDIATFSFYPTKNLGALGDAGAVVTNSDELADRVRSLHQYGWGARYHSELPHGRNSRIDELQAAILTTCLPHLGGWNNRRVAIVNRYHDAAPAGIEIVHGNAEAGRFVGHLAIGRSSERERCIDQLEGAGVATSIHYPVLDTDAAWIEDVDHRIHCIDQSIAGRDQVFTLPCFPTMTDQEIDHVCASIAGIAA